MIIGVMSDTHGNRRLMHSAAEMLSSRLNAQIIIHLGDNWTDKEELDFCGHQVWGVPGLWCSAYRSGRVPKGRMEVIDGIRIAFAHDPRDLVDFQDEAHVLLTGHTHEPRIDWLDGRVHMNPGHLKRHEDRGHPATFGLIHVSTDMIECSILDLNGETRLNHTINRRFLRPVYA